jgi:monoamine oxidase
MNPSERINSTVDQLEKLYPGLRDQFEGGYSKYWGEDEWSKGAWAGMGPRELLVGSSPEGRVHFAGEHLSFFPSWMQGALVSGLRAAKEIIEAP